jgi:hypothetical protein
MADVASIVASATHTSTLVIVEHCDWLRRNGYATRDEEQHNLTHPVEFCISLRLRGSRQYCMKSSNLVQQLQQRVIMVSDRMFGTDTPKSIVRRNPIA